MIILLISGWRTSLLSLPKKWLSGTTLIQTNSAATNNEVRALTALRQCNPQFALFVYNVQYNGLNAFIADEF